LAADHIIDLGPEGGDAGGELVATGSPYDIMQCAESHTGAMLREMAGARASFVADPARGETVA
jgi:excinuclease ABC subunit A